MMNGPTPERPKMRFLIVPVAVAVGLFVGGIMLILLLLNSDVTCEETLPVPGFPCWGDGEIVVEQGVAVCRCPEAP